MLLAYFIAVIVMSGFGVFSAFDAIPYADTLQAKIAAWTAFTIAVCMLAWSIYLVVVIA